jgi:hypothetical protein
MGDWMTDENKELHRLRAEARGLQRMVELANSQVPTRSEGIDSTGAVEIVLGDNGLPRTIHVEDGWDHKLRAERLGQAVIEAFSAAFYERLRAWTTAFTDAGEPALLELEPEPEPEPEPPDPVANRLNDPDAYALAVIEALDNLGNLLEPPPVCGIGSVSRGGVVVTLTGAGMVSCTADPTFITAQSGEELTQAFGAALAAAKEDLARAQQATPLGRLRKLLDLGLTTLDEGTAP